MGMTFVEYLTQRRMQRAKELLRSTDIKISNVGYDVGYKDFHYFHNLFKMCIRDSWYTMHKIMAGLLDLYKFAEDPDALEVAKNLGTWIYNRVSKWDNATQQRISWTEYGGMNDCMYELYKLTGDTRYRDAAHRFDDPKLYQEILSGKPNTLNQRHRCV